MRCVKVDHISGSRIQVFAFYSVFSHPFHPTLSSSLSLSSINRVSDGSRGQLTGSHAPKTTEKIFFSQSIPINPSVVHLFQTYHLPRLLRLHTITNSKHFIHFPFLMIETSTMQRVNDNVVDYSIKDIIR